MRLSVVLSAAVVALSCGAATDTVVPTPAHAASGWAFRSIDTMAASKDHECHQLTSSQIDRLVATDETAAATHVAISSPFDDPGSYRVCTPADGYTDTFVAAARRHSLNIWIRSHWLSWQGDYGVPKMTPSTSPSMALGTASGVLDGADRTSYLGRTYAWILARPSGFWRDGDIFTPASEPANAGIEPYCSAPCMFSSSAQFNEWLRDSMTVASAAFRRLGIAVRVGWWGLACSDARIESSTIEQMGVYVTDCYYRDPAQLVGKLGSLRARYGIPVVLGEWGDIWDGGAEPATADTVSAAFSALAGSALDLMGVNYFRDWGGSQGEGIVDKATLTFNPAGQVVASEFRAMVPGAPRGGGTSTGAPSTGRPASAATPTASASDGAASSSITGGESSTSSVPQPTSDAKPAGLDGAPSVATRDPVPAWRTGWPWSLVGLALTVALGAVAVQASRRRRGARIRASRHRSQ